MHGSAPGDKVAPTSAEATDSGIVLTSDDLGSRVGRFLESKLDGRTELGTPETSPLLAALISDIIKTAVADVMDNKTRKFESEAEITALIEEIAFQVASAVRKQMNAYAHIAFDGYEIADAIHDPGDDRYGKVKNGSLIKLAIRANRSGYFELEIKFREILRRRKDTSQKERLLNLYHLQDSYHSLGNSGACIAINRELIAYIGELREAHLDEEPLKLDYTVDFMEVRANDTIFSVRRDLGEDCQAEAITYYDSVSAGSTDHSILDVVLRRLRVIFDDKKEFEMALSYSLELTKIQHADNRYDEHRRTERHITRYLADLQIDFEGLGIDAGRDGEKLAKFDIRGLRNLVQRAKAQVKLNAERAILEIMLERELTVSQRISTFCDLDQCYAGPSAAEKKLALLDRYKAYLDSLTADDLSPGQNLASLKFRAGDSRYRTQVKSNLDEMRNFYEDHLVSEDADETDRILCFKALCALYEAAEDHAKAWDCAVQILHLPESPHTVKVSARDAERRNGDRLSHAQREKAGGLTVRSIQERKAREEQARLEEEKRRQEQEAREAISKAKGELLTFLEVIQEEAQHWEKAGRFKDMRVVPGDKRTQPLEQLDRLLAACKSPQINRITVYVRQELNATNAFIKLDTVAKAIEEIRRLP